MIASCVQYFARSVRNSEGEADRDACPNCGARVESAISAPGEPVREATRRRCPICAGLRVDAPKTRAGRAEGWLAQLSGTSSRRPVRKVRFTETVIKGDLARKIEARLADVIEVEVEELRDYLAGNIGESSHRRTGTRFIRGTHGGHYIRDPEGTDLPPVGVSVLSQAPGSAA